MRLGRRDHRWHERPGTVRRAADTPRCLRGWSHINADAPSGSGSGAAQVEAFLNIALGQGADGTHPVRGTGEPSSRPRVSPAAEGGKTCSRDGRVLRRARKLVNHLPWTRARDSSTTRRARERGNIAPNGRSAEEKTPPTRAHRGCCAGGRRGCPANNSRRLRETIQ